MIELLSLNEELTALSAEKLSYSTKMVVNQISRIVQPFVDDYIKSADLIISDYGTPEEIEQKRIYKTNPSYKEAIKEIDKLNQGSFNIEFPEVSAELFSDLVSERNYYNFQKLH